MNCSESYCSMLHCELGACFSDTNTRKVYRLPPEKTSVLLSGVLETCWDTGADLETYRSHQAGGEGWIPAGSSVTPKCSKKVELSVPPGPETHCSSSFTQHLALRRAGALPWPRPIHLVSKEQTHEKQ